MVALLFTCSVLVISADPLIVKSGLLPSESDPKATLEFFSPKVSLDSLRFAFVDQNRVFCELSDDQEMLFIEHARSDEWDFDRYTRPNIPMPADAEEWVFERIPESRGDPYTIFDLTTQKFFGSALTGVVPYGSGDGFRGFIGRLGEIPSPKANENYFRPFGLVYAGNFQSRARFSQMPELTLSDRDHAAIWDLLAVLIPEGFVIHRTNTIYFRYPKFSGVVLRLIHNDPEAQWLYCFVKLYSDWKLCPINSLDHCDPTSGGGIIFLDMEREDHFGHFNSELHILPDIDGNGSTEWLMIADNSSVLFSLVETYVQGYIHLEFRAIKSVYFGL